MKLNLLSVGTDAKTSKGEAFGWLTAILYLAPAKQAGRGDVCSHRSIGCTLGCLYTAGRGKMSNVKKARIRRTQLFFDDVSTFKALLFADIRAFVAYCETLNMRACVRLNGTSDIAWERLGVFAAFPSVQFYDYTKVPRVSLAPNYHLTFSYSAEKAFAPYVEQAKNAGLNMAAVFRGRLPDTFLGLPVISGDDSDLRFLDSKTHEGQAIVGLLAKGKAKKETNSFVIDPA